MTTAGSVATYSASILSMLLSKAGLARAPRSKQGDVRARLELQGGFLCEGLARNPILDRVLPDEGVERPRSIVPSERDAMYLSSEYSCALEQRGWDPGG